MAKKRSTHELRLVCPAQNALTDLVKTILPGRSRAVEDLRRRVMRFCADPLARAVLLRGSIGVGKSSLARLIGLGKRIAHLREEKAQEQIRNLRYEGPGRIDPKLMPWYVEFTVTGLVDELASAQLFGIRKGAATDIKPAPGVFERAQVNEGGRPWDGAAVTGGVVFLDEIADISESLQAKLLPVLSGGRFYRVGGEGDPMYESTFEGVVVTATWQELQPDRIRSDLLSRIAHYAIDMPGIGDRLEDLPDLVSGIQDSLIRRHRERITEMIISDPDVDRAFWETEFSAIRPIGEDEIDVLKEVDWSRHGEMRGLTNALERIVIAREDPATVLRELPVLDPEAGEAVRDTEEGAWLYSRLLEQEPTRESVVRHVKEIQLAQRTALRNHLNANPTQRRQLARKLDIEESRLINQLRQLDRSRGRDAEKGGGRD